MGESAAELKKLRWWFMFTPQEMILVGGVLAIFLVGLAARWWRLRQERADAYRPAGIEAAE